jgi:hypothetical protein
VARWRDRLCEAPERDLPETPAFARAPLRNTLPYDRPTDVHAQAPGQQPAIRFAHISPRVRIMVGNALHELNALAQSLA